MATSLLTRVVDDGRNLDALCDHEHGLAAFLALEDRDRQLARAIALTALRHRNAIEQALRQLMNRPTPRKARLLVHTLHIAAAQILYLEVPDSAAVDLAIATIKNDTRTTRFSGFANAVLRRMTREAPALQAQLETVSPLPDWLERKLRKGFGKERAGRVAKALNQPPRLDISVKSDPASWVERLDGTLLPWGSIRLSSNQPVQEMDGFADGQWWVQDAAAALPAKLLGVPAGAEVLELCAAPGGKTAQLVNAGFKVTALDISAPRLARLQTNLERLHLNAEIVEADILDWTPSRLFDAVLLDAPCSSTGTARRHPDVMWARSEQQIAELADLQRRLIERAADFLKPGGCLVFSNCSMLKEEGEHLFHDILRRDCGLVSNPIPPDLIPGIAKLIDSQGALRSLPYDVPLEDRPDLAGLDGFFACRFIKAVH